MSCTAPRSTVLLSERLPSAGDYPVWLVSTRDPIITPMMAVDASALRDLVERCGYVADAWQCVRPAPRA